MGGQDGFARDPLTYDINGETLMAGLRLIPAKRFELGLGVAWTQSDAAIQPMALAAPEYAATHGSMAYDFTETHTYSDLDVSRLDANLDAKVKFVDNIWMTLMYRHAELEDDAPYLYDTSGSVDFYAAGVGWSF
jgi:hypothetical protein